MSICPQWGLQSVQESQLMSYWGRKTQGRGRWDLGELSTGMQDRIHVDPRQTVMEIIYN